MRTQHRHIDDLLSQARGENNIVSKQEIDALLDAHELHGRQFDDVPGNIPEQSTLPKRGIVMGILSTVIVGGLIGAGTLFWNADRAEFHPAAAVESANGSETGVDLLPDRLLQNIAGWSLPTPDRETAALPVETAESFRSAAPVRTHPTPILGESLHQKDGDDPEETVSSDMEAEADELERQIGSFVTDYWYDRINSYRRFIDRSLASSDLAELNRLRVRWELAEGDGTGMLNFQMNNVREIRTDDNSVSHSMSFSSDGDGASAFMSNFNVRKDSSSLALDLVENDGAASVNAIVINTSNPDSAVALAMADLNGVEIDVDTDVSVEVDVESDGENRGERKVITRVRKLDMSSDGEADAEARTFTLDGLGEMPIGNMLKMAISLDPSERSVILRETWSIADRNRSRLDGLKEQVLADVAAFNRELGSRLRAYAASSDGELAGKLSTVLEDEEALTEPMMRMLTPLYDVLAEPMLMLYNGSDITPVLSSAITEPVAGITLDGRSALAQSYPNPASSHATIDFTLAEQSSATTLRLFDVNGNEVLQRDLGELGTGTHSEDLDLSGLPAGTYLYHLTVEGTDGNRVWSRALEVVR